MSSYLELKAQLATLELKIEVALAGEKAKAIREVQATMIEWRIRPQDLQDGTAPQRNKASRKSNV
jgi:DNA-binding protein H-NS